MRVGLLGAGTMGRVHALAWRQVPGVELLGVAGAAPAAAAEFGHDVGVPTFRDLADLVAAGVQVVDVCLPTDLHAEAALAAMASGCDVICEKPLTRTLAEAQTLLGAAAANGRQLYCGQVLRFFPAYRRIHSILATGELGRVGVVRTTRAGGPPRGHRDWYADVGRSGGVTVDLLIHDLDFLGWAVGPVRTVQTLAVNDQRGTPMLVQVLATLADGTLCHLEASWAHHEPFFMNVEVAAENGLIQWDSRAAAPLGGSVGGALGITPYQEELAHFAACWRGEAEPQVTAAAAAQALAAAAAAETSARTGRAETVPEVRAC